MAFIDFPINALLQGKRFTGFAVSQSGNLGLQVASGTFERFNTGQTYNLTASVNHLFSVDSSDSTEARVSLVQSGSTLAVWIDTFTDDGTRDPAATPSGYTRLETLAWFTIAPNETNLSNTTINRRTFL